MNIFIIFVLILLVVLVVAIMLRSQLKICGGNDAPEITFDEIKELRPNFVYIHGMVASGKSTLSEKIGRLGYKVIHIDELVRETFPVWPKDIYLAESLTPDQEKLFDRIKKEIDGEEYIVVDGFIAPPLWKALYAYRPWDVLVYVQHRSPESYREAIWRRALNDLQLGRQTLSSFWRDPRSEKMIAEYKEKGEESALLKEMVEENAKHKWESIPERRAYVEDIFDKNGWPYRIYYTDIP